MSSDASPRYGVFNKPFVEQLKLLALFVLIGLLIYFSRPTPTSFAIGAVLVALGTLIRIWAGGHLTRDQKLTTSGPYEYSRNPFYLGRLLLIIGFAAMSGMFNVSSSADSQRHIAAIVLWVIFIVTLVVFFAYYMPRKEKREGGRLQKLFGPDYEIWKQNVPSLFPRFTPYKMHPKPWSRDLFMGGDEQYSGNKELWTTLTVIVIAGLFYWRMASLP